MVGADTERRSMLGCWAILAGLVALALMPISEARAERRVALVVGNAKYDHAQMLRNPQNDANDIAELLSGLGFEVVRGIDLDQQNFARAIGQFARQLEEADVALFFYAGHGLQINEKNYLVSTNARLEDEFFMPSETIELDAVIRLMESKSAVNLVFLDACRNNPLAENLRRSLAALKRSSILGRGLARVEATGRDTLIAFAAAPGQEAADGADRNSPFTGALLKRLPQPGLEVSVMLKEVAADVRRETRNAQRPQQLSDMSRTFYFAKTETPVAAKAAPPPAPPPQASVGTVDDRTLEVAVWNAAVAANTCDGARAYLQRYPNGIFVEFAKGSERRLCAAGRAITVEPKEAGPAPTPPRSEGETVVAALPDAAAAKPVEPSLKPAAGPSDVGLAREAQKELLRVGCGALKADGKWGPAARAAVRAFNRHARTKFDTDEPSVDMIAALRTHDERVCPLECGRGFRARGDVCVAIEPAPPPKKREAARPPPRPSPVRPVPAERKPEGAVSGGAAPAAGGSQFNVGGRKCRLVPVMTGGFNVGDTKLICD